MATSHFRHQFHLYRAKLAHGLVLGLLLALLPGATLAQGGTRKGGSLERNRKGKITGITVNNLPEYDHRWFHPGLYFAPSFSRFFIEQSQTYIRQQNVTANSIISPCFGVGVIADARLGPPRSPFVLRFAPGVVYLSRRVEFTSRGYPDPEDIQTQEVGTTILQFPLLLKYQSDRRRNTRAYVIAGINPTTAVTTRRDDPLRNVLSVNDTDVLLEYGVGLDLFYPLFKFAPELRFSHGLKNILIPHDDVFSNSLQSLKTNTVTLYINLQN